MILYARIVVGVMFTNLAISFGGPALHHPSHFNGWEWGSLLKRAVKLWVYPISVHTEIYETSGFFLPPKSVYPHCP